MDSAAIHGIPAEICQRIAAAAEQLYQENGKTAFPNVDAVRRKAQVNMNSASSFMKAWRRLQVAGAAPQAVAIPEGVHRSAQEFLAAVWRAATDSATAGLQAAQAGWDIERTEAETARSQLAAAFDQQTDEFQALQSAYGDAEAKAQAHAKELTEKINELLLEVKTAEARAAAAEAAAAESRRRAEDLLGELNHAHQKADQAQRDLSEHLDSTKKEMDDLRENVTQMREVVGHLRGELQAEQSHNKALLSTLARGGAADTMPEVGRRSKTKRKTAGQQEPNVKAEEKHIARGGGE